MMMRSAIAMGLCLLASPVLAAEPTVILPVTCTVNPTPGSGNNYSATVGASPVTLIPAPSQGVTRTAIWIQMLTSGGSLAVNPSGGTPSLTVGGNMVLSGQYAWMRFSADGFMPTSALTAIADSSGRVVTAFACPQ